MKFGMVSSVNVCQTFLFDISAFAFRVYSIDFLVKTKSCRFSSWCLKDVKKESIQIKYFGIAKVN